MTSLLPRSQVAIRAVAVLLGIQDRAMASRPFALPMLVACLLMLAAATARAQPVAWTQRMVAGPSPRYNHAMAYDAARGVTVLFGGYRETSPRYNGETWEWDGTAWTQRIVSGPLERYGHSMAYDSARGVTVLFGGLTSQWMSDETWEWDGATWTQRTVTGPSPRELHAMAYDSAHGVTVLFGGYTFTPGETYNGETWEWNGAGGGTWTQRLVSGPSPRVGAVMTYDAARGVTVLYGGVARSAGGGSSPSDETWEWNGTAWTQRVDGPSPRSGRMAYDAARHVTVLFGGYVHVSGGPAYYSGETWEWDGTAWTQRMVSGPSPRGGHAMTFDASRGATVLFGGDGAETYNGETWLLAPTCGSADFNHDGLSGTDADIEAFFACLAGNCCPTCGSADFNGDGDAATDADIEAFFRVLAGGTC
jgi:hypothetical protein